MNFKKTLSLVSILVITLTGYAQEDDYYGLEDDESPRFYFGFNIGAYFANAESAVIYNGSPSITPYGINFIFNQPYNQQIFDNYFQYPYAVEEYPVESKYKTAIELGAHISYRLNRLFLIFAEVNTVLLDYENYLQLLLMTQPIELQVQSIINFL